MSEPTASVLARLAAFARALGDEGLPVGTERVVSFVRAVTALESAVLENLYWAGRLTLVARREDLARYDRVFSRFFCGQAEDATPGPAAGVRNRVEGALAGGIRREAGGPAVGARQPAHEIGLTVASPTELLRQKSFDQYTADDHEQAKALLLRLARREPLRRSRRTRPSRRRGPRPDLPRTLRQSLRTQGEPFRRTWRRRHVRPRRLVLVLDVSGSMSTYADGLARFAHAAAQAGRRHVEAFAFGTHLTRITPALSSRDPDAALAALGNTVNDWQGGTRIAESLQALIDRWGRRGLLRGAVVVLLSDGLERGEPDQLADQMRRLARLAHRVVWANPLKGSPVYQPLARGMAAALPYVDEFLPGHNLASVQAMVEVIERFGA